MSPHKPTKTRLARTAATLAHVMAVAILALPVIYLAPWVDPAAARHYMAPSLPSIGGGGRLLPRRHSAPHPVARLAP